MKGDFTRNTFDPRKHYTRVLMQQGRVQLDADWNELNGILLYYLRALAADLIGPHGGPGDSFEIGILRDRNGNPVPCDFEIAPGHYYVDGILCENDAPLAYTAQPDYPLEDDEDLATNAGYLVYLDVWERHVTHVADDGIREVALGGPDTATRAQVVWQVKVLPTGAGKSSGDEDTAAKIEELRKRRAELQQQLERALESGDEAQAEALRREIAEVEAQIRELQNGAPAADGDCEARLRQALVEHGEVGDGRLRARARLDRPTTDPCTIPPEARYRGAENQLYRVEIHRGGTVGEQGKENEGPTFVWSRDNAAKAVYPIRTLMTTSGDTTTTRLELEHLGRDGRDTLTEGDWVEIVDDHYTLRNRAEPLLRVTGVDRDARRVTLAGAPASDVGRRLDRHPLLVRWDSPGEQRIDVPARNDGWLALEDGVEVKFEADARYRAGDYWLIPARTATGDVEWPQAEDVEGNAVPAAVAPHGVEHHYVPLATIAIGSNGAVSIGEDDDCRCTWTALCRRDAS